MLLPVSFKGCGSVFLEGTLFVVLKGLQKETRPCLASPILRHTHIYPEEKHELVVVCGSA